MEKTGIKKLFRSKNTVFTFKDISLILEENDEKKLRAKLAYYVNKGELIRLRKGIYAKDRNYNKLELAVKVYTPSYISLETVLAQSGVIFQYYEKIFVVSYLSREIVCDHNVFAYKKLKQPALVNSAGIEERDNYYIATRERAFMDALYFYPDYHFDNLKNIDKQKCRELLPVYDNKSLVRKLDRYLK